jgi:RHS repeat-associated protein
VRQLADASADVTLARSFEPLGTTLASSGAGETAWQFTGEARDTYITLYYLRARWLDPSSGRFTSRDVWPGSYIKLATPTGGYGPDPSQFVAEDWRDYTRPLTLNGWLYVEANPINRVDPSGHQSVCVTTPSTGATNTALFDSCDAVNWVTEYETEVVGSSNRHGIPPELVAGILASEIDFDTGIDDLALDNMLRALYYQGIVNDDEWSMLALYACLEVPTFAVGVGQIEYESFQRAQEHYNTSGYSLGAFFTSSGADSSKYAWTLAVLTSEGAIEGASVMARYLADYRTGSNGLPKTTTHFGDLTTSDMAQIFGAYRAGVGGLTCFQDVDGDGVLDCGFPNAARFQELDILGPQASQALPYFEYFQTHFQGGGGGRIR